MINATTAARRPLIRMERRLELDRCENHPKEARIRPTKLLRRSGRAGTVSGSA